MVEGGSVTCVVEAGDLVLFDRRCAPMGPLGASICYGAKALTMTPWDHVGVVVQREDGELCVLDAGFSGTTCYPLLDRLKKSKSNQIAIRKLYCTRTAAMKQSIRDYVAAIMSAKYNNDMQQMMQAAFAQVEKSYLSKSKAAKAEADLLRFLWDAPGVSPVLVPGYFLPRHHKEASDAYYATVKQGITPTAPSNGFTQLPAPSSQLYCSQLVADLYQRLGLLPLIPEPPLFIPADFSSAYSSSKLSLKPGAVLGKDIVISLKSAELAQENGQLRITQPVSNKQAITLAPGDIFPVPVGCAVRVTGGDCEIMASQVDHQDLAAQKQLPLRRLGVFPMQHELVLERGVCWTAGTPKKDGFHLLTPQKQSQVDNRRETQFLVRAVDSATIQCTLSTPSPKPELRPDQGAALIGLLTTAAFLVGNAGKSSALHYTEQLVDGGRGNPYTLMHDGLMDSVGQYVRVKNYKAGDVMLPVGDTARGLMTLVSGEVAVTCPSGAVVPVAAKSACFNAESLVDGQSLSELRAVTDVEVLELTRLGMCIMGFMSSIGVWGQKRDPKVSLQDLSTNLEQHGAQKHLTTALRLALENLPDVRRSGAVSTTTLGLLELLTATGSQISELMSTGAIVIRPPSDSEQESPQAALLSHTIKVIRHSIERKAVVARHSTLRRDDSFPRPIATSVAQRPMQLLPTPNVLRAPTLKFDSVSNSFQLPVMVAGAAIVLLATKGRILNSFARCAKSRWRF